MWLYTVKQPKDFSTVSIVSPYPPGQFTIAQERAGTPYNIIFACEITEEEATELFEKFDY